MINEIIQTIWQSIHGILSRYLVDDKWFYISTGTAGGGYTISEIFYSPMVGFSSSSISIIDKISDNPVAYATAFSIVVTLAYSMWQKRQSERRAEEQHDLEMKIKEQDLN